MIRLSISSLLPVISLLTLPALHSLGQEASALSKVLDGMRSGVAEYRKSIPDFSCHETVLSQRLDREAPIESATREATLRVRRTPDDAYRFDESRTQVLVDGKEQKKGKPGLPFTFSGGFAEMLGLTEDPCITFQLEGDGKPDSNGLLHVSGRSQAGATRGSVTCHQSGSTSFAVDARNLHIRHLDQTWQDVSLGSSLRMRFLHVPSAKNYYRISVDYAPVTLGDRSYLLPSRIVATITDKTAPYKLFYQADYSGCQRYTSTSTILPTNAN